MEKIKVIISREDGSPICRKEAELAPLILTDENPFLIIWKNGGTVETASGHIPTILEFATRQLEALGVQERRQLRETFGLELQPAKKFH